MRISDWSSDVCSSDLLGELALAHHGVVDVQARELDLARLGGFVRQALFEQRREQLRRVRQVDAIHAPVVQRPVRSEERRVGKSVSVRVDLGGRRIIYKTKQ